MKGFKDSTKTQYERGGAACYAKGGAVKGAAKISKVMGEFKKGTLHSGSKKGPEVTNPKQATAIALSEARKAGAKIPVKKNRGGMVDDPISRRPVGRNGKPITDAQMNALPGDEMSAKERAEMAAIIGRANRASAAEAGERALIRKPPRGPAGAGYNAEPKIQRSHGGDVKPVKKSIGGVLKKVGKVGLGGLAGLAATGGLPGPMGGLLLGGLLGSKLLGTDKKDEVKSQMVPPGALTGNAASVAPVAKRTGGMVKGRKC